MIQLTQLSLNRAHKSLLERADLTLHSGQKVGLIGKNGSGKTSLFMMLRGELPPEDGKFSIPNNLKMSYIQQDMPQTAVNALDYAQAGDELFHTLQQEIAKAEQGDDGMHLAELHMKLAEIDGYSMPAKAAKILHGLGFSNEQLTQPVNSFSGGWQMRLHLAHLLMDRADILLLDEPTNHLDLEAIVWLEDWLRASTQTILLISHDREFVDNVVTHIAHLYNKQLKLYTGNYSRFEKLRAAELTLQQASHEKQQAARKHLQSFVDRFRYKASKARQAQSRIKMLERMDEVLPLQMENPFRFEFNTAQDAGNPMLTLDNVSVGYDEKIVLKHINFSVRDGDRIGLLGLNGAGKSTLIKLINEELSPLSGKIHRSNKIRLGYFAQHQLALLDANEHALHHLKEIDRKIPESRARQYLGGFNFSNDDVFRPVGTFSGGEKARLVLALIIWQQPNLLLLDEPTNHLDLEMREALNLALQEYTGALILVSHDRHLLRCTSNEFLLVANHRVTPYTGDLEDYQRALNEQEKKSESEASKTTTNKSSQSEDSKKVKKLEEELIELERLLKEVDEKLSDETLYLPENKTTLNTLTEKRELTQEKVQEIEMALLKLYN